MQARGEMQLPSEHGRYTRREIFFYKRQQLHANSAWQECK